MMPTARPWLNRATAILVASAVVASGAIAASAAAQAAVDPETLTFEQLGAPLPVADLLDAGFEGGAIVDSSAYARTFESGAPSIADDAELGMQVATIAQEPAAAFATPWSADDYTKMSDGFALETVFRMDAELSGGSRGILGSMAEAGFGLEITNSDTAGREHLSLYASSGAAHEARASDALEVGRWYHVVGTYDGESLRLYLDGALVAATAMTGAVSIPAADARIVTVGADAGAADALNGSIALAHLYSEPIGELDAHRLSRAELLSLDTTQPLVKPVSEPAARGSLGVEYVAPAAVAVDDGRAAVSSAISVVTPDGTDVALTARGESAAAFTPEVEGTYTLRYSAVDAAGNLGEREYPVVVGDAESGKPADADRAPGLTAAAEPHVAFGAIGDIHDSWDELRETYDFYDTLGLDATLFVGDLTNNGTASEYNGIKQVIQERQGARALVAALGNHDTYAGIQDYDLFKGATGLAPNADYEIKGYHFIAVSPGAGTLDEATGKPSAVSGTDYAYAAPWLESRLAADTAQYPDRPVFILVHAPIRCTHYTSNLWYGSGLASGCGDGFNSILEKFPQAVVWSGHNHTPNNIPTSIWQGTEQGGGFTSVNAPSMATMYVDPAVNGGDDTPDDTGNNRQTAVVEVTGSVVTIRSYDLLGDNWIDQTWMWDVADSLNSALEYPERFPLGDARALQTSGPLWAGGAAVAVSGLGQTAVTLTHPQAAPAPNDVQDITYYYRYELVNVSTGARVQNVTQASGFYVTPLPATRSKAFTGLVSGTQYEARITPYNAWGKAGLPLTQSFTTSGPPPEEPQAPGGTVLSTTTRAVTPGIALTVAFAEPADKSSATNKVAIYKAALCEGTPIAWAYTSTGTQTAGASPLASGTVSFPTASWTYGTYTACLLYNDQAAPAGIVGDRLPLTVVAVASDKATVVVGQPITFRFGVTSDRLSRTNWIGVYNKATCSTPSTDWMYLNSGTRTAGSASVQSGSRTFSTAGWAAGTTQKVCLVYNDSTGNFIGSAFTINVVAAAPTPAPVITGTANPGQTLTALPGTGWSLADATYTYQWKAGGTDIPGATGRTLVLGSDIPIGTAITVTMTATSGSRTESATTPAVTVSRAHSLSLSATSVERGTPFTVSYTTWPANARNWIGIYSVDQGEPGSSASLAWEYAPDESGSVTFSDFTTLPVGRYRVEFLYNDGYTRLVDPLTLTLTAPDTTEPTNPPPPPVPDSELEGAPTGGVTATPSAVSGGEQVVVSVGTAHAGEQVRIWLHSTPVLLGTYTVSGAGTVRVTLPAGTAAGSHRLVVQALDGSLIGWTAIEVRALPNTGSDPRIPMGLALGMLLLGGLALVAVRRRRAGA